MKNNHLTLPLYRGFWFLSGIYSYGFYVRLLLSYYSLQLCLHQQQQLSLAEKKAKINCNCM